RHTRFSRDWSSDVCSSDLEAAETEKNCIEEKSNILKNRETLFPLSEGQAGCKFIGAPIQDIGGTFDNIGIRCITKFAQIFPDIRSEERRVGKECRYRRTTD